MPFKPRASKKPIVLVERQNGFTKTLFSLFFFLVFSAQGTPGRAEGDVVPYEGAKLHKRNPAKKPCVTDVLSSWEIAIGDENNA